MARLSLTSFTKAAPDATPDVQHEHVPAESCGERIWLEDLGSVAGETEGRERQALVLGEGLQNEWTGWEHGHQADILPVNRPSPSKQVLFIAEYFIDLN